jgi:CheY-like chemotaxis protein
MDEQTLMRASEPFFTTKGPGKGTGLGLSMVHGLAAQSGGAMALSSEAGAGTTVRLWLPKSCAPRSDSSGSAAAEPSFSLRRSAPSTILLVDDDVLVRAGTVAMLEDLGHVVIEAESGLQALEQLTHHGVSIDIIITDHAMPGMKGLDLIRLLRASHPLMPVILATGYAEITEAENTSELLRLSKPFRQADLASAIAKVVGEQEEHGRDVISVSA